MKYLKSFVFGMVTVILFVPVLESISETILTSMEYIKGKATIRVLKLNKEIAEMQNESEKTDDGFAIGFQCQSDDEYEYEDDFEDKKKGRK